MSLVRTSSVAGMALAVAAALVLAADDDRPPEPSRQAVAAQQEEACRRPYSASSPWNTPIGPSPVADARSRQQVAALDGRLTSDPTQYTYPVYRVGTGTPRANVRIDGRFSDVSNRGRNLRIQKEGTVSLPIPPGAQAAEGSDAQMILLDRSTGDEWGVWRLRREDGGWAAENGYRYNTRWDGVPPADPSGRPFGSRGAGVPYLAGLVRPCEIARGRIDHALAFAYDSPTRDHVYPATKSDGKSSFPDLPEGSRLQLDPSLSRARIEDLGCTGPCLVIARALQRYGMYVIDNSGRPKIMLEYEGTARWGGTLDEETVSPIPLSAFTLLRSCTTIGTRRSDVIRGTPRPDVVCARGGDDRVLGGGGDDVVFGEGGDDELEGGAGRDRLHGHGGDDTIAGGGGRDVLLGGQGADALRARDGARDLISGGPGRDRLGIDRGSDRVEDR